MATGQAKWGQAKWGQTFGGNVGGFDGSPASVAGSRLGRSSPASATAALNKTKQMTKTERRRWYGKCDIPHRAIMNANRITAP